MLNLVQPQPEGWKALCVLGLGVITKVTELVKISSDSNCMFIHVSWQSLSFRTRGLPFDSFLAQHEYINGFLPERFDTSRWSCFKPGGRKENPVSTCFARLRAQESLAALAELLSSVTVVSTLLIR